MDVTSLKRYIYENNKIEYVLEQIGCNNIQYHPMKEYYSCSNYDGDNKNAINVKNNEYLNVINWTRNFGEGSDLITLVEYNENMSFIEAVKYIHSILGIEYKWSKKPDIVKKFDPLSIFKKHKNSRSVDVNDIHVLDEELLDDFVPLLHIDWFKESIMPWTREKFGLAYSYKYKRVVIPIRYALTGELLGFNMRTTVPNYEMFDIPKYFLTPTYQKSLNVFGMWENREVIEQKKIAVIYESEKSVFKRHSRMDGTGLALQGKNISDEQVRLILGLKVNELVICLDNDVPEEEVFHMCEKFYRIRKVSYIKDSYGLLGEKDSPADASNKIFDFLFKYRTVYDDKCHKRYIDSLKR